MRKVWLVSALFSALLVPVQSASAQGRTGLDFPSNGGTPWGQNAAFVFKGSALINRAPATYIHRYRPRQHTGYYTEFFWNSRTDQAFVGDRSYYGCHPYPPGGINGPSHKWEISIDGRDYLSSLDVAKDAWYTHVVRVTTPNGIPRIEFWWDYAVDKTRKNDERMAGGFEEGTGQYALIYGGSPWSDAYHIENGSGVMRGIKQFNAALSDADIAAEAALSALDANTAATEAGKASLWYSNVNPTPTDISDKSGKGHHPAWFFNPGPRPTLWTEGTNRVAPAPTAPKAVKRRLIDWDVAGRLIRSLTR